MKKCKICQVPIEDTSIICPKCKMRLKVLGFIIIVIAGIYFVI